MTAQEALRAEHVLQLVERFDPAMAAKLHQATLAVAPADMDILFRDANGVITDGSGEQVAPLVPQQPMPARTANAEADLERAMLRLIRLRGSRWRR